MWCLTWQCHVGRGAFKAILEMIGLVFPVTFSPQATPSFPVIQKEILFSSEPLTPPPDRMYAPSQKVTYLAMVGQGSKGVEINKWVSSSKFSPSPLPQDALSLCCPQGDQRRQQTVYQSLGLCLLPSYQLLRSCSFGLLFPYS